MDIALKPSESAMFEQYAKAHGLSSIEEAVMHAAHAELTRRYRLPARQASVVPIQGLKSPGSSE